MLSTQVDHMLLQRVRGEFLEMPGLRLTSVQAQRLWALDRDTCASALDALVADGFLTSGSDGRYMRLGDSTGQAVAHMAKAELRAAFMHARVKP